MRGPKTTAVFSVFVAVLLAWTVGLPSGASGRERRKIRRRLSVPAQVGGYGIPLSGLTADELAQFQDGQEVFAEVEDASDGLGPTFNNNSCAACHSGPVVGGGSPITVTRFAKVASGLYTELPGGSLLQSEAIRPECAETVPGEANVVAHRQTTALFGFGLIEAIPDREIIAYSVGQAAFHPGQAGAVNFLTEPQTTNRRVGRFGWKAQHATLVAFSGDAYLNEMGITNRLFPDENAPNGDKAKLAACDAIPELEDEDNDTDAFASFMRFLAPPPQNPALSRQRLSLFSLLQRPTGRPAPSLTLAAGQGVFERVGCAVCHYAGYSAVSRSRAIDGQRVEAYSDFLLHDIGTADNIVQGNAKGTQFRTAPLWGVATSAPYLHDGSAATLSDAIRRHGNQGAAAERAFEDLSFTDRDALLAFLAAI